MKDRIDTINKRIEEAASTCGRDPENVKLVAVGKTKPVEDIKEAALAGIDVVGENYIQEARTKFEALSSYEISWHFIGHLQSNKAKYAVKIFDLIHTVDSLKLAYEIDKQAKKIDKIQDILVQVNISMEESKSGITDIRELFDLLRTIGTMENISVKGLMTIPPYYNEPDKARPFFRELKKLAQKIVDDKITDEFSNISMDELSMGMTGDFEIAIEEGATLVRIGTAIFGTRL
ncbi:YggS family pyridoxal phosphate-dependent enzyme [Desulfobacterales bacterium HSG16]|nr:YggS family pyridoxal phosphate-dependent enzyme [Desulfobacterales bacterium HSG16]